MTLKERIPGNPYIVGTPIKTKEMFFGREKEFQEVRRILLGENKGLILTLAGERRIGKTSMLFQILNGRLGEGFATFFVDMQSFAGIENTAGFLKRIADDALGSSLLKANHAWEDDSFYSGFEAVIIEIQERNSGSRIVFLVDEYEIFEKMIEEGRISAEIFQLFNKLMETYNLLFLFTGSNTIENRKPAFWKTIQSRSCNLKIFFLEEEASRNLITRPLEGYISFPEEVIARIIRLTAGHSFYIQFLCQNLVELLVMGNRTIVTEEDIDFVVSEILNNTLYPMIYFWQALTREQKIVLSSLGHTIKNQDHRIEIAGVNDFLETSGLTHIISEREIEFAINELWQKSILSEKDKAYAFTMDFFRFWVQHEQNIWKICEE
jgi:AAA+ ATPase superfamily predicted ATPase